MAATPPPPGDGRFRDALLRAAALVEATTTARLALQRLAALVEPETLPEGARAPVAARFAAAGAPEPVPLEAIERQLRSAWGRPPHRVLDDMDPEPVAVTPGAQVHRAVAGGEAVAVKVRRPGVAQAVRRDLAVLDAVVPLFAALGFAADLGALARAVRERLLDELDLEHEAANQRAFHRALRRHPDLSVPAPRTDLAHDDVLVGAWVDGTTVRELAEHGDEPSRRRAAELAVRFFLGTAATGRAHAEPHPDDVLLLADGRLGVLDFGAATVVPKGRAALVADLLEALGADDAAASATALGALGLLPDTDRASAHELVRDLLGGLLRPSLLLDDAALGAAATRAARRRGEILALARRSTPAATDIWPLRGAAALALLLARLRVEGDWADLACDALRHGP